MKRGTYHTGYAVHWPMPVQPTPYIPAGSSIPPVSLPIGQNDGGNVILAPGANGYPWASLQTADGNFALETSAPPPGIDGGGSPYFDADPFSAPPTYGINPPVLQSGDAAGSFAVPGATSATPARPRSPKRIAMDAAAAAAAGPVPGARSLKRIAMDATAGKFGSLSNTKKILIVGGGVVALFAFLAYRRVTAPLRYARRIGTAVKGVHKAITG